MNTLSGTVSKIEEGTWRRSAHGIYHNIILLGTEIFKNKNKRREGLEEEFEKTWILDDPVGF